MDSARGSAVQVYAQNMHEKDSGAFTGEITAPMLSEIDVQGVILGHSERRQYYNETDRALQQKVPRALEAGLIPILCVGETEEERERGDTERKLRHQVQEGLEKVPVDRLHEVVVAYEPIWAIGTGLTATTEIAQDACGFVRALVQGFDKEAGNQVRVLYGGSLKPENAAEILSQPGHRRRARRRRLAGGRVVRGDRRGGPLVSVPHVVLIVLDGWGLAPDGPGNAVSLADTPVFDELWASKPHTQLIAMGPSVGLPEGQMGNSEVGHLNLGAGAIVPQDLARIDKAVEDGTLGENEVLQAALQGRAARAPDRARERRRRALVRPSPEGADRDGARRVIVHAFTDGRDTSPKGGAKYLADVESWGGRVGSVIGRYFAMDRDKRWDRVQKAYDLLVHGKADHHVDSAEEAAKQAYERDETDEFIAPTIVGDEANPHPPRRLRDRLQLPPRPDARDHARAVRSGVHRDRPRRRRGDRALHHARRVRRGLGLSRRLPAQAADDDDRRGHLARRAWASCTSPRPRSTRTSRTSSTAARSTRTRARCASCALPARRADLRPQAGDERARGRGRRSSSTSTTRSRRSSIINFANPDMVGHTGVIEAAVKAVETVDECLGQGRRGGPRGRRRVPRHRRPRQLRPHAQRRRLGEHRALAEPGAVHRHRGRRRARRRGHPGRRRTHRARAARASSSREAMTGRLARLADVARSVRPDN